MAESHAKLLDDTLDYLLKWRPVKRQKAVQIDFLSQLRSSIFRLQHTRSQAKHGDEQTTNMLSALERLISAKSHITTEAASDLPRLRGLQVLLRKCTSDNHLRSSYRLVRLTRCYKTQMRTLVVLSNAAASTSQASSAESAAEYMSLNVSVLQKPAFLSSTHVGMLHKVLADRWHCRCTACREAYISLKSRKAKRNTDDEHFDMIFGLESPFGRLLQEGRIMVSDELTQRTRFHEPDADKTVLVDDMCAFIHRSVKDHCRFSVRLSHAGINRMNPCPKEFDMSQHPQSVSLTNLFSSEGSSNQRDPTLPLRGRRVLAAVIAKALGPLLATPWLDRGCAPTQIHFFRPMRQEVCPSITEPFLTIQGFNKTDQGVQDTECQNDLHPVPGILALGILLCELHYCTPISFWRQNRHLSNGHVTPKTDFYTTLDVLSMMERSIEHVGVHYAAAIKACLGWSGKFTDFSSSETLEEYHNKIVTPLDNEASHYAGIPLDELDGVSQEFERQLWGERGLNAFDVVATHGHQSSTVRKSDNLLASQMTRDPLRPQQTTISDNQNYGASSGLNMGIINNYFHRN